MIAVISHNVLFSNYVPFFEIEDSSLEALDTILVKDGGRLVRGNDLWQLLWVVNGPKVLVPMEDGTTIVTRTAATVTLCGYKGTALTEWYCETFNDLSTFDAWIKGLDAVYVTSLRLSQVEAGSNTFRLHPDLVQRAESEFNQYLETEAFNWKDEDYMGNVGSEEDL